ncbi:VOC family protein [Tumebacillus avium]|nr:VOC family protein [Tumebacillus avium]
MVNTTGEAPGESQEFSGRDRVAIILRVENVDAAYEQLKSKDALVIKAPHDTPEFGMRVAYFRDPAGNLIELNQEV